MSPVQMLYCFVKDSESWEIHLIFRNVQCWNLCGLLLALYGQFQPEQLVFHLAHSGLKHWWSATGNSPDGFVVVGVVERCANGGALAERGGNACALPASRRARAQLGVFILRVQELRRVETENISHLVCENRPPSLSHGSRLERGSVRFGGWVSAAGRKCPLRFPFAITVPVPNCQAAFFSLPS